MVEEMKDLVARGEVAARDMVWKEGIESWIPASSVHGLVPGKARTALPPIEERNDSAGHRLKKVSLWIVGALFGLIVIVAMLGPVDPESSESNGVKITEAAQLPSEIPKVGDSFATARYEFQIRSAQLRSSVGTSFLVSRPSEGGMYVVIHWVYKNISDRPVSAFNRPTIYLMAPDGTTYQPDLSASMSHAADLDIDAKIISDLNPGIQVADADVFEVSRQMFDQSSWRIVVNADRSVEVEFVQ